MLDDELLAKLRKLQSEKIRTSDRSVSFSKTVNEVLRKSL